MPGNAEDIFVFVFSSESLLKVNRDICPCSVVKGVSSLDKARPTIPGWEASNVLRPEDRTGRMEGVECWDGVIEARAVPEKPQDDLCHWNQGR